VQTSCGQEIGVLDVQPQNNVWVLSGYYFLVYEDSRLLLWYDVVWQVGIRMDCTHTRAAIKNICHPLLVRGSIVPRKRKRRVIIYGWCIQSNFTQRSGANRVANTCLTFVWRDERKPGLYRLFKFFCRFSAIDTYRVRAWIFQGSKASHILTSGTLVYSISMLIFTQKVYLLLLLLLLLLLYFVQKWHYRLLKKFCSQ